ncbi:MAG: diaminopimelate epimerase [Oscillospiraceae bacterium]|nr:diaminopimelate epimerase [Oscillospiraceae bacterium]
MKLEFSKMHGIGNDYVYVNCIEKELPNPEKIAQQISQRRFSVGADGLVLIMKSDIADFKMRMFNADGSEGKMGGSATRCVGKYLYDKGLTDKTELTLETISGIKNIVLFIEDGKVAEASVDMGKAILKPSLIPVKADGNIFISQPVMVNDVEYKITAVSMGNPHAVVYVENPDYLEIEKLGLNFEKHEIFPDRANTEFVSVLDRETIKMRVWKRGSGETFASGTGACASVVASVLNGFCDYNTEVTVILRGGELKVTYQTDGTVIMRGSATHVFDGVIEL